MTLKSLNTRYVKLIRKMAVTGAGLLLAAAGLLSLTRWGAGATGFNLRPAEAGDLTPALQGVAAITHLKERKLYDSLRVALNAARSRRGDYSAVAQSLVNEQKLTASDGAFGDEFGHSVAISGSTIVVGARADTIGGNLNQGSAYVFNRHGGSWVETQKLTASDGAASDQFGWSVAVSGSTIVVGAWLDDIGANLDQGSAYVFSRQGGGWVETQKLTASDGATRDHFGWSVTVSGSTVVVGAPGDDSAYVFNRQGGGWVETQKLTASDGAAFDFFGWSVAVSGSTVVVGSRGDAIGANINQGSAYVFNRHGGSWVEAQKLTASDGGAFDEFGNSVAVSGSTIVVGSPVDAIGGNPAQGSAYVFNRHGGDWVETQKLTASDGGALDFFGNSVAVSGSTVVVGAVTDDIGGNLYQGSAYVFTKIASPRLSPQEAIAQLIDQVEALVAAGDLKRGQGEDLINRLEAAIKQLDRGHIKQAINQLLSFIFRVALLIARGELTPAEGQSLIGAADEMVAELGRQ
jgi:glutamate synthase domain-containing protein 3